MALQNALHSSSAESKYWALRLLFSIHHQLAPVLEERLPWVYEVLTDISSLHEELCLLQAAQYSVLLLTSQEGSEVLVKQLLRNFYTVSSVSAVVDYCKALKKLCCSAFHSPELDTFTVSDNHPRAEEELSKTGLNPTQTIKAVAELKTALQKLRQVVEVKKIYKTNLGRITKRQL